MQRIGWLVKSSRNNKPHKEALQGGFALEAEVQKTAMSHDEMQDYWQTLCSFSGEDIPNEVNQLMAENSFVKQSV